MKDLSKIASEAKLLNVDGKVIELKKYNSSDDYESCTSCYSCQCDGGCDCVCQSNCCDCHA